MTVLEEPERWPLREPEAALDLGRTVVVAPHPDDESLGCGGLLAILGDAGLDPRVVVVTDGSRSHASAAYPPDRLAALREGEALAAVSALGLGADAVSFLRHPDCGVPGLNDEAAVAGLADALREAETVVVPWRRDPHCDHEDAWALARAAVACLDAPPRWLEYAVWAWEHAATDRAPRPDEVRPWRLDIADVLGRKRAAVAAHVSQTTRLIDDDPDGFVLEGRVLAHFDRDWELYLDPADA
ncbi:PIG-L deacetylase family protein [Rubrivirga sp. IMCC43871]|uniref:PIG-L deacetylase family protein n=1 Tax=Rubrivirga sp. IMCC43871 TaxID=3391575 RepID=UPI00398FFD10